jgi:hypothetical protein
MANATLATGNPVKARKVCVVGSTGHRHVKCTKWEDIGSVNLLDFDDVVIVMRTLPKVYWSLVLGRKICQLLARLLVSGGNILVFGDHWIATNYGAKDNPETWNYVWSPIDVTTIAEAGDTVDIKENPFPKLFSRLVSWDFYYSIGDNWRTMELAMACKSYASEIQLFPSHLILNRYGQPLSTSLQLRRVGTEKKHTGPSLYFRALDSWKRRKR